MLLARCLRGKAELIGIEFLGFTPGLQAGARSPGARIGIVDAHKFGTILGCESSPLQNQGADVIGKVNASPSPSIRTVSADFNIDRLTRRFLFPFNLLPKEQR